jgi:2-methylisocitrate lyase-like PEP mutase family enzyme
LWWQVTDGAASYATLLEAATERARAGAQAGASGFFVPGLADAHVIKTLCTASARPVNIMVREGGPHVSSRNAGHEQDQLWAAAI